MINLTQKKIKITFLNYCLFMMCMMIISCKTSSPKSDNVNTISNNQKEIVIETKKNYTNSPKLDTNLLKGVWGKDINENANFQIMQDTIYYPDADMRLKYTLSDSTMTVFDENGDTNYAMIIVKLTEDSLVVVRTIAEDDSSVFLRFKE
jgi:hypothetical protein